MNIATDLFLQCIRDFLVNIGEDQLAKKVEKRIEHDVEIKEKHKKKFNLKRMIMHYLREHEDLKKYLEKLTTKIIEEAEEDESEEEEIKPVKEKEKLKQKSRRKSSFSEMEKTIGSVKRPRKASESEASVKNDKAEKNQTNGKSKRKASEVEDDDSVIDPIKMRQKLGISEVVVQNNEKLPFRRIDPDKFRIKSELADNSYETYAKKTGNTMGLEADKRLKTTAGKDFRKEKTKFKNKSGFGGNQITMEVKSIKLDYGSD